MRGCKVSTLALCQGWLKKIRFLHQRGETKKIRFQHQSDETKKIRFQHQKDETKIRIVGALQAILLSSFGNSRSTLSELCPYDVLTCSLRELFPINPFIMKHCIVYRAHKASRWAKHSTGIAIPCQLVITQ